MPRNGSGTYTLPAGNPVVSGDIIESSWANSTLSDLADSITNSLARNGEGGMTAALRLVDGTVSVPGLAFANETGSGLYRAAAGDVGLAVLGSRILRLRSTGVDVEGALAYTGTFTGGTGILNIGSGQLYKAADGKVGIGTATPATLLNMYGVAPTLRLTDSGTGSFGQFVAYDAGGGLRPTALRVSNDGTGGTTDVMTWTSSGNVGIGTSSPAQRLHVAGSTSLTTMRVQSEISSSSYFSGLEFIRSGVAGGSIMQSYRNTGTGGVGFVWSTTADNAAEVSGAYTQRMFLDNSGNLLIAGTTWAGRVSINQANNGSYQQGIAFIYAGSHWNTVYGASNRLYFGFNNIDKAYVDPSTGSWNPMSDRRAKKSIEPISYGLDAVLALQAVQYHMLDDEEGTSKRLGFIAQDVKAVIDEAVDATDDPDRLLGLDKSVLVPVLVKAIQELKAEVDALKSIPTA
jgi:hypothetical protein